MLTLSLQFDMPSPESCNAKSKPIWNGLYSSYGIKLELNRVGNIQLVDQYSEMGNYTWPAFITGGDITRDGKQIFLRGYNGKFDLDYKFLTCYITSNCINFGEYLYFTYTIIYRS